MEGVISCSAFYVFTSNRHDFKIVSRLHTYLHNMYILSCSAHFIISIRFEYYKLTFTMFYAILELYIIFFLVRDVMYNNKKNISMRLG